ncbi:MAG: D-alanyl-D-alanine carboxypeptidase family protein, partial [Candidatus Limnocylindria bacterium]
MPHRSRSLCLALVIGSAGALVAPPAPASAASFTDIAASPFRADIVWLAERGVTGGCTATTFCPRERVTREQMAAFLVRMFDLPASTVDKFRDDDASQHEAAINALAAAGITGGCRAGAFCPHASVTREQMASFIARAARLPGAADDYFLDDERSIHEPDTNRAAAAGVTGGCEVHVFCGGSSVSREQMAAFLHRVEVRRAPPAALPDVGPLPACRYDDVLTSRHALDDWNRTMLDTIFMLPSGYGPADLVRTSIAGVNGGHSVRRIAAADLVAMASAARAAGRPIAIVSAFRSYAAQVTTFNQNVARYGLELALRRSARPGHSEHQLGTTLDVTHSGGAIPWSYHDWATHPTGAWMRDNAWRFGFVMSYPKGSFDTTCYDYEPWHYRYVGREMARLVRLSGLTLREVIWRLHGLCR